MIRALLHDRTGASAAEFALVLPLLILFLFGIVDVGRWLWVYNEGEKATQIGARFAVVSTPVSSAIGQSYVGLCNPPLTQGDNIPASCFGTITCTNSSCSSGALNSTAFTNVVERMKPYLPGLAEGNVTIEYSASGLGYAGNPDGPDVSPLVTVKIGTPNALQFAPITFLLLSSMDMPTFTTSLTAEDLSGAKSN